MKKTIITIALLVLVSMSMTAQEQGKKSQYSYTKEGKTFVQSPNGATPFKGDIVTDYVWRDSKGKEYPIILHTYTKGEKAGRVTAYVIRTSAKSGKEYKYYLPNGEQIAQDILNDNR